MGLISRYIRMTPLLLGCMLLPATGATAKTPSLKNMSLGELAELFSRYPQGDGFQISPEGDRFFAKVHRNGETGLVVIEMDDLSGGLEKGRFFSPSQTFEASEPRWVDNDFIGYNVRSANGIHSYQVVSCKPDGNLLLYTDTDYLNSVTVLEYGAPTLKRRFFVEKWDWTELGKKPPSIALIELGKGLRLKEAALWKNPGFIEDWYFLDDVPYAVYFEGKTYRMDFDLLKNEKYPDEEKAKASLVEMKLPGTIKYLLDAKTALVYVKGEDGLTGVAWYNPEDGKLIGEPVYLDGYDLYPISIALRTGGPLVGLYYHTEKPKALYFDPQLRKIMKHLEDSIPNGFPLFRGLTKDNRYLFYIILSDNKGSTLARFDLKTGENRPIYHTRPWLQDMELPSLEPVSFPNRNGDSVHGYMMLPKQYKSGNPVPLVVIPNANYGQREHWEYNDSVQFLTSLGFAVLRINYRGSNGYGDSYQLEGDFLRICQESPKDVIDGIRWAVEQGIADGNRVALYGKDYGANVAIMCSVLEPEIANCVIADSGFYDYSTMLEKSSFLKDDSNAELLEKAEKKLSQIKALSPINFGEKIKVPVMLFHKDYREASIGASAMQEALDKSGVDVELLKLRTLSGLDTESDWNRYYNDIGAFLIEHLGN